MEGFNKYQYSEFAGAQGQFVVRTNDRAEFEAMLKDFDNLKQLVSQRPATNEIVRIPVEEAPHPATVFPVDTRNKCPECGAQAQQRSGVSKTTGKPYNGMFCTANREHKPTFI